MPDSEIQQLERALIEQARQWTSGQVDVPAESLLALHRGRRRRRQAGMATIASAGVLLLVLGWWSFIATQHKSSPGITDRGLADGGMAEGGMIAGASHASATGSDADRVPRDPSHVDQLAELIEHISDQLGTEVELITIIDERGIKRPAIYIPERVVPIRYEELSPTEQSAVLQVLDEPPARRNSI